MSGTNYSLAAGYRAYVEQIKPDLITEMFTKFKTGTIATPHEGTKGKVVLSELEIATNVARRWTKEFRGTENASIKPKVLEVVRNTVEHREYPQQFEGMYLGLLRQREQSPTDWPIQAMVLDKIIQKLRSELEVAFWQAEAAAVPADTDLLRATFDGALKQIADAIVANDLTPVVNVASTLTLLRTMWEQVADWQKEEGTDIFMSYKRFDRLRIEIKDTYKIDAAYTDINGSGYRGMAFELGANNTTIIPISGMGDSDRVIIMPRQNLHYQYDAPSDWDGFRLQELHRHLDFWSDFNFGVGMTFLRNKYCVVNDAA